MSLVEAMEKLFRSSEELCGLGKMALSECTVLRVRA
jgi:hypothetical protein